MASVRLSRPADKPVLMSLDLKCYHYPMDGESWAQLVRESGVKGKHRVVIAETALDKVGFAIWDHNDDGETELMRLGVHPQFRRCGIGTRLVAEVLKSAMSEGSDNIRVVVPEIHCCPGDEDDVSAFLDSCEFKTTGEIVYEFKEMYGRKVDGFVFQMEVSNAYSR